MKVLVVTPTLGRSPWLDQTVASVAAVDAKHALVAPADVVSELQRRYPATKVLAEPGGGMYAAINAGAAADQGWRAVTYLNDDDLLLRDFAQVVDAMRECGGELIAYGGVRLIDASGNRIGSIPISSAPRLNRSLYAQRIEPVYQHGTLITREAFERLGGFDASFRYCGDSEFLARACMAGIPFVCATRHETAAFRLHAGQLTKRRDDMTAERRRVDEKLGLTEDPPAWRHRVAAWRFRLQNAVIYAERIRHHGFVSFDTMLEGTGG